MSNKQTKNWYKHLPKAIQEFIYLFKHLKIEESQTFKKNLLKSCVIFCMTIPFGYWIIGALKNLIPGYLQINPLPLINEYIFFILLATTTVLFSFILTTICSFFLILKKIKFHHPIFNRSITVYAFLNILIITICIIMINRLMVTDNMLVATGNLDFWIANTVVVLAFSITLITLIIPLAIYLNQYYNKKISYIMSITAVVIASSANPVLATSYFKYAINQGELCKQLVEIKFKEQLETGALNKDCIIGKCLTIDKKEIPSCKQ